MGGGNAQKSKTARDRNLMKKAKEMKQKNHSENKAKMDKDNSAFQWYVHCVLM